jgi:hypothetical protein
MKEECWMQAAAIFSQLDQLYHIDEQLAKTQDSKAVVGMINNAEIYFQALREDPAHPGRAYYTEQETEEVAHNIHWLKSMAESGGGIELPLRVLKDKLFNMAVNKAVLCECGAAPRELPTFQGYTVDNRLKEFRKLELGKEPVFVPFDSTEGQKLLEEIERAGLI